MPPQASWLLRVPEILQFLRAPAAPPFLDRPAIERLFGLSRRQAIRLMGLCGGYQVGKTFLLDRMSLVEFLEGRQQAGDVRLVRQRKQRIASAIESAATEMTARRIEIRTSTAASPHQSAELPQAIQRIAPGKLQISYGSAEDLLSRIVELASAASRDFPGFQKMFEDAS